jgi:ABC-type polysaccharide/polyol phosphate export permease
MASHPTRPDQSRLRIASYASRLLLFACAATLIAFAVSTVDSTEWVLLPLILGAIAAGAACLAFGLRSSNALVQLAGFVAGVLVGITWYALGALFFVWIGMTEITLD